MSRTMRTFVFLLIVIGVSLPSAFALDLVSLDVTGGITSGGSILTGPRAEFVATFDSAPDPTKVVFRYSTDGGAYHEFAPTLCDGSTCSVSFVPMGSIGSADFWVAYGSNRDWYAKRIAVEPDTQGPEVSSLSFSFGPPSVVSFASSDPSGVASYRLMQDGTTIASGTGSSADVTLLQPLAEGDTANFALVLTDSFGNAATRVFGGIVDTTPPSVSAISTSGTLGADGTGYFSFTLAGDHIDVGTVHVMVGSKQVPAACPDADHHACTVSVRNAPSSAQVTVTVSDAFGNTAQRSATVSFHKDTTPPVFKRIATEYPGYDAQTSYVDQRFFIEFDENGVMDPADVIAKVGSHRTTATSCTRDGTTKCWFDLDHAATVEFVSAKDLGGNDATIPSGAITTRSIDTDTTRPDVSTIAISSSVGVSRADQIVLSSPGDIQILADVRAEGSEASRLVLGRKTDAGTSSDVYQFDCQVIDASTHKARCTSPPITISATTQLSIDISDASGSAYHTTRLVSIGSASAPGVGTWEVLSVSASPSVYLPSGSMPVTLTADLGTDILASAITLAGVKVKSCTGIDEPFASTTEHGVVITGFSNGGDLDNGKGSCTLEVRSIRGGRLDPNPQDLDVNFTLTTISAAGYDSPGAKYSRDAANSALGLQSVLDVAKQVDTYANILCTVYGTTNDASGVINGLAALLGGDAQISPLGAGLSAVGGLMSKSVDGIGKVADPLCAVANCAIPLPGQEKTIGSPGSLTDPVRTVRGSSTTLQDAVMGFYHTIEGDFSSTINGALGFDVVSSGDHVERVQDSLVLSAATACIPGIVDNLDKINQIQCGHQLCLLKLENGDYLGSASMCEYAYSVQTCTYIGDQLFATIPFGPFVHEALSNAGSTLQQPLKIAANWVAGKLLESLSPSLRAVKSLDLGKIINLVTGLSGTNGGSPAPPDYCGDLGQYIQDHPGAGSP